jgi:putative oligomerization/nucleic acid binding protein
MNRRGPLRMGRTSAQIAKLAKLRAEGQITDGEYKQLKAKAMQ